MIKCQNCGSDNLASNRFCGTCGQPLAAPPPASTSDNLPAWLQATPSEPAPSAASSPSWPSESADASAANEGEIPAWLRDLQNNAPAAAPSANEPPAELPAWLFDETAPAAPALPPTIREQPATEVPAWLQSTQDTPSPQPDSADNLPDWLRDAAQNFPGASTGTSQSASAPTSNELPDWLREATPAAPIEAAPTSNELPDWLREATPPPAAPIEAAPASNELPDWLREATPPAASAEAASASNELPDWLREATPPISSVDPWTTSPPPAEAWATPPAIAADDAAIPDWLREPTPSATSLPASESAPLPNWLQETATTQNSSSGEVPDWLRDDSSTPSVAFQNPSAPTNLPSWSADDNLAAPPSNDFDDLPTLELPDWSSEFGIEASDLPAANSAPAAPQASGADQEELPSWLAGLTPGNPPAPPAPSTPSWLDQPEPTSTPAASSSDAVPSWLQESAPTVSSNDPVPSWLQESAPAVSSGDTTLSGDLPDWLQTPAPPAPQPGSATVRLDDTANDVPDWLRDDSGSMPAPASPGNMPDWLSETGASSPSGDLPPWLQTEPASTASAPVDGGQARQYELPADDAPPPWLQDDAATSDVPPWLQEPTPSASASAPPPAGAALSGSDLPDWLADLDAPSTTSSGSALPSWLEEENTPNAAPANEFLGSLDLPGWLRGTTAEPTRKSTTQAVPTYLDLPGTEIEAPVVPVVPIEPVRRVIVRSTERLEAMAMLERLLSTPAPEPMPVVVPAKRNIPAMVIQALSILLILGVVLGVLLGPPLALNFGATSTPSATFAAASAQLNALPPGQPVLIAYEWDPGRQAELQPLANAVLTRLKAQKVPLIFLSTDIQGQLLADAAVRQLIASGDQFYATPGLGYINLGYKPGGNIALARLAQDFGSIFAQDANGVDVRSQSTVIQNMCAAPTGAMRECRVDSLGLIVVLADEQADVQDWIEQVHAAAPGVPMLLATPSEIAPQAQPYTSVATTTTGQVTLVSGLGDVQQLDPAAADAGLLLNATTLGAAAVGLLALLGIVPAIVLGRRGRKQGARTVWDR